MKTAQWSAHIRRCSAALLLAALAHCASAQNSSLYDARNYRPFITDQRAAQVGDSLVVLVYESAAATNQAKVTVNKETKVDISATDHHNTLGGAFNTNNGAEGGGVERRSGEVIAKVSALRAEVSEDQFTDGCRVRGEAGGVEPVDESEQGGVLVPLQA